MASRQDIDLEERAKERLPGGLRERAEALDSRLTGAFEAYGITALRIALGIVYVWFGALKVVDRSPVEDLVRDVVFLADGSWVVPAMGAWEIVIGLGLIVPIALRITLLMLVAQLVGTLGAFVVVPGRCFDDSNPLLLTTTGEFVLKNLVLISAALVIGSTVRRRTPPIRERRPGPGGA